MTGYTKSYSFDNQRERCVSSSSQKKWLCANGNDDGVIFYLGIPQCIKSCDFIKKTIIQTNLLAMYGNVFWRQSNRVSLIIDKHENCYMNEK